MRGLMDYSRDRVERRTARVEDCIMAGWLHRRKVSLLFAFLSLALASASAWLTRDTWLAWYYLHGLKHAPQQECDVWVERLAGLDTAAVPHLVDRLKRHDASFCERIQRTLARLCERWGSGDDRTTDL